MGNRDDIKEAVRQLGLGENEFVAVPEKEARPLLDAFFARFTGGFNTRWWWENFTMPTSAEHLPGGEALLRISDLVPDVDAKVWLVVEDGGKRFYPVYDVTPAAALRVIGECSFEYYLIAKDLSWLLCENHHEMLIAIGDPVRSRMDAGDDPPDQ